MNITKNTLTLNCTNPMVAHWGDILIPGQEYTGEITYVNTEIVTDYENYWKYVTMMASSVEWIAKGYTQDTLHEVIPGYKNNIDSLYTKRIDMPFIRVKCSDNKTNQFCLLSTSELFSLGCDYYKVGRNQGKPCFRYTVYLVDDYFDYVVTRRDNILNELGI